MIPSEYAYLTGNVVLFGLWIFLYYKSRKERKGMLIISSVGGLAGLYGAYFWWTTDWWFPVNITETRVGVEDFLVAFSSSGIAVSIYHFIFKRKYRSYYRAAGARWLILIEGMISVAILSQLFGFKTTFTTIGACILMTGLIVYARRDLLPEAFWSGTLTLIATLLFFYMPISIGWPLWPQQTYLWDTLSGVSAFGGFPIEEFVFFFFFFFFFGAMMGPFHEYWKGLKFVS